MLTKNFISDIQKSVESPVYIELNRNDIDKFLPPYDYNVTAHLPSVLAAKIYNEKLTKGESNLLIINPNSETPSNRFILLEALINYLEPHLKSVKNIEVLKKVCQSGVSIATAGWLDAIAGEYFDLGVDFIFDEVGEFIRDYIEEIPVSVSDTGDFITNFISGVLTDSSGNQLANEAGKLERSSLFLSSAAKKALTTLSPELGACSSADIFQLTFKLMSLISIGAPKLIWVNNPQYLDVNSLALLSLLFAQNKHYRENGSPICTSVVYQFGAEQFQPYKRFSESYLQTQVILQTQRNFAQRYGMLERPTHDMPQVCVNSSTFVGRTKELNWLTEQFKKREPEQIVVVAGEPGIGKTTLINRHINAVKKCPLSISLTLLNEVGNISTNTGLSSLETSIVEETQRIAALSKWKNKTKGFAKQQVDIENAVKIISKVLGVSIDGLDKLAGISEKLAQRLGVNKSLSSMRESSNEALNSQSATTLEKQFKKLDRALEALLKMGDNSTPIVLFVDDIQWIDNVTARYLLTTALRDRIYIICSLRPSDAATLYVTRQSKAVCQQYKYVNYIFSQLGVGGEQESVDTNNLPEGVTKSIKPKVKSLNGLEKQHLVEIIGSILGCSEEHKQAIAEGIISALTESEGKSESEQSQVNTLFAVETINVLFDQAFNQSLASPLFINNVADNTTKPFIINPAVQDIATELQQVFIHLKEKYRVSLAHFYSSDTQSSYSLMAYAVMEERINLLKVYFGEFGNCVVFSLLISSIVGSPFSSELVKNIIERVIESDDEDITEFMRMLSIKEEFISLTAEHYAVLENVYEILKRLPFVEEQYRYQHGLYRTFFRQQLRFLLSNKRIPSEMEDKKLVSALLEVIIDVINEKLSEIASGPDRAVANHLAKSLLNIKIIASDYFLDIDPENNLAGFSVIENSILLCKHYLNDEEFSRATELFNRIEQKINENPILQVIYEFGGVKENFLYVQAHAYRKQNLEDFAAESINAYRALVSIAEEKYKNHPIDNHKYYARVMSEVNERYKNNLISKQECYFLNSTLYKEFTESDLFLSTEPKRLKVSLLMNIGSCADSKEEKLYRFQEAHYLAERFYLEHKEEALSSILEAKHKLSAIYMTRLDSDDNEILTLLSKIYRLCTEARDKVPNSYDSFYYPCVCRLFLLKKQYLKALESDSSSERISRILYSIDSLDLPELSVFIRGFFALKNTKSQIFYNNVEHFASLLNT